MDDPTQDIDNDQREALDIARQMIEAGVPIFAAPPCPAANGGSCGREGHVGQEEFDLPPKWQLTVPSTVWLERWQPGWGLGAVGGHTADFLDEDPRNGGADSIDELDRTGHMPRVFGVQSTPSGGRHYVISPIGERKSTPLPGLDYQGGAPDGGGRGFVWIAPTSKRSKITGVVSPYRWEQNPDLEYLAEFDHDDSVQGLRDRILAKRAKPEREHDSREAREFTETEARTFCDITLQRLMKAEIGEIEEAANAAAAQLSHFVPDFWSEEFAYAVLTSALGATAYDPEHPASSWRAEKFHAVLSGQGERAPGDWKAIRRPETVQEAVAEPDEVDALLAEMLTAEQIAELPAPRPLIKGLLDMDSEAHIIGMPGSKKSFVVLDMAGHIARGEPWQGLKTTRGEVIMIVAEGASGTGKRVRAWNKQYGQMTGVRMLPRPVQVKDFTAWKVLVEACRRVKPVMVVIDTQARVTVGMKENDAGEMGYYNEAIRAIREATGACVLTVHHTGKDGQGTRGSSALDGAQGTRLMVTSKGPLRAELSSDKQKDMRERDKMMLHFVSHDLELDEDGEPITSLVLLSQDAWRDRSLLSQDEIERPEAAARSVRIPEPQRWTQRFVPETGLEYVVRRQILQTLAHLAGTDGMTESQVRAALNERWYAEVGATGRTKKGVDAQTWKRSWTSVMALADPASGETVVAAGGTSERKIIHPDVVTDE